MRGERLRLLLIGSTVVAFALTIVLGVPRVRSLLTPRIQRVWVVSAALGDQVASGTAKELLAGTPATLFAVVEAVPFLGSETRLYGTIETVALANGIPQPVAAWSDWWYALEFLWFKVEPLNGFANPEFDPEFDSESIVYTDAYQVAWGFGARHAVDVTPSGDGFPNLDTGTMRFAARAVVRDWRDRILQQVTSASAPQVHAEPDTPRPHRVSVREGDDALGWLQGYAGLPYVPIVAPVVGGHPVEEYLGGTVLDFWMAAARRARTYDGPLVAWERLADVADVVVDDMFLANDGIYYWTRDPLQPVSWDILQPGDILTIDDHAGVLAADRGPGGAGDGVVSRWDDCWEAYFEPLRRTQLGDAFVSDIRIWRLRAAAPQ